MMQMSDQPTTTACLLTFGPHTCDLPAGHRDWHHCPTCPIETENTMPVLPPVDAIVEVAFRGRVAAYNDDYNGTVSVEVLADDGRSLGYYANVPREAVWIGDEHAGGA